MKTYSTKTAEIRRDWHLLDAKDAVLGRLSTKAATLLMGKHKPTYTTHIDNGDQVVVINASAVKLTGNKDSQKLYHRHSGYPGGMRVTTATQMRDRFPERILIHAISGMLPDNKLKARMLTHLHVYPADTHPYQQHFKKVEVKS